MTLAGRLASLGFADAQAAQRLITGGLASGRRADEELLRALAAAADPDAALAGLARIAATDSQQGPACSTPCTATRSCAPG